jgi:hypothetical protein
LAAIVDTVSVFRNDKVAVPATGNDT